MRKIKIGLVLGSGGAKGLSHIGVLKILERENIKIDCISGSSIGAIIGGFYAKGYSSKDLEDIALSISKKDIYEFIDFSPSLQGIIKGDKILNFLRNFLGDIEFSQLKVPFLAVAVDLITGEKIVFTKGKVISAIRGSISIPVIFQPYPFDNKLLIDGGVLSPLPVEELKEFQKPDIIIGINLQSPPNWSPKGRNIFQEIPMEPKGFSEKVIYKITQTEIFKEIQKRVNPLFNPSLLEVLMQTINIMNWEIALRNIKLADIVINPRVENYRTFDFDKGKELIKIGESSAEKELPKIKELIKKKSKRFLWF
ncbi:MAG: patatin-like phospholipase family protein [Dictyoglomus sp.]|nr:patatin-like phospholipase family protein [Dictyoglomus sp.]MCX7845349.1 patatin-like phospholipase family protein [Dictyoglomaceae bacterium]MDW8188966.1 patatin-like phospholipase family protein [Dictyoglomus sp.]